MKQVVHFNTPHWLLHAAVFLFFLLPAVGGQAQGLFEKYEITLSFYEGNLIEELPDGTYRLVVNSAIQNKSGGALQHLFLHINSDGNILDSFRLVFPTRAFLLNDQTMLRPVRDYAQGDSVYVFIRTNLQNDTLWTQTVIKQPVDGVFEWMEAELDSAGNTWVSSVQINGDPIFSELSFVKFSPSGEIIWQKTFPTVEAGSIIHDGLQKIKTTQDRGCLSAHTEQLKSYLLKLDALGEVVWQNDFPSGFIQSLKLQQDGRSLLIGRFDLASFDANGNKLFQLKLSDIIDEDYAGSTSAIPTPDGGWALAGNTVSNSIYKLYSAKISAAGLVEWVKYYDLEVAGIRAGAITANHDWLWTGTGVCLIRMDSTGLIFKNHLAGRLANDQNVDCAVQTDEPGIPRWLLKLENTGATQYAVSEPDGSYYFAQVDTGQQALTPIVQNYLWEGCQAPYAGYIHPDSSDYTLTLDAPIQSIFDCPVMTVDLAVPFLRRCFNNTYAIQSCNYGNLAAEDAYVELFLPPHLLVQSASAPFVQDGLKLTFELGTVDPFECIDIQLVLKPDCDSTEIGQAMCVSAHIFPDTLCGVFPGWSGALIEVSAACDGDSVRFEIHNTGNGPTSQPLDFIVIDDHVMTLQSNFNLVAQASHSEVFPADGSTWRLLAEQEPNAPGAAIPSVAVEGCAAGGGPFNMGFIIQWPNENGSPFWERDCHEIVASFDPNDKQAAPAGVDNQHWIKPNTPIEYLIRFQNTGTDTAFTVELRDTLSAFLDPESIRPGAASHPYSWSLSGDGVLRFLFENILLPDSNTNEAASHGFVHFRINQQPDLPDGILIENSAAIYFDFNAPVLTNTTFHTVGRDFLPTVSTNNPAEKDLDQLSIYPNPARDRAFVFLKNKNRAAGSLALFDTFGRVVWTGQTNSAVFEIRRQSLPAGLYWLRFEGENGVARYAKLVWE